MHKKILMLLISTLFLFVGADMLFASSYDVLMSPAVRVTNNTSISKYPSIAVDAEGQVYIAWTEGASYWLGWGQSLYYTTVNSSGSSQTPQLLSGDVGQRIGEPALAAGDGNIMHVLWHHNNYAAEEMYYRSIKPGGTITPWKRMTYTNSWNTDVPRVKIDPANGIHVTYSSETPYAAGANGTHFNLYYKKYQYDPASGGVNEIVAKKLTSDGGIVQVGGLDLDSSGDVHIVWQDDGGVVNYAKLDGGSGGMLVSPVTISPSSSRSPSISVDKWDHIHIAWAKAGEIYYAKLDNQGNELTGETHVANSSNSFSPGIVVDSHGNPHIAWIDAGYEKPEMSYVMLSGVDGSALTDSAVVSDNDGFLSTWLWPSIAIDHHNTVHIAWQEEKDGNSEIYYRAVNVEESNRPPVADAGPDQTLECAGPDGSAVTLDGSGSSDPDNDALTYTWTWSGGTASGVSPSITLPLGTHTITLTVDDGKGGTATDDVTVIVRDTTPPVTAVRTIAGIVGDSGWYTSDVLITVDSTDSCSGVRDISSAVDGSGTTTPGDTAAIAVNGDGSHTVAFGATDNAGNSEPAQTLTINIDTTAPTADLSVAPGMLWPPNHKMVDVLVSGGSVDGTSGVASVVFTVTDEYGTVQPDISGFNTTIPLEAWREGTDRDGRHYTITAVITDTAGNATTVSTEAVCPHDMKDNQ